MGTMEPRTMDELVAERDGIAVMKIDGRFHVVRVNRKQGQVYSCLPSDNPENGSWFAGFNPRGIKYVSRGRTRAAAMAAFRRAVRGE
jgi:hypothetical protein